MMEIQEKFYETICRVCLTYNEKVPVVSLVDSVSEDGLSCYGKAVVTFTNIPIKNDRLPGCMCQDCLILLKQAIVFRKQCENSHEILTGLMKKCTDLDSEIEQKVMEYVIFRYHFPDVTSNEAFKTVANAPSSLDKAQNHVKSVTKLLESGENDLNLFDSEASYHSDQDEGRQQNSNENSIVKVVRLPNDSEKQLRHSCPKRVSRNKQKLSPEKCTNNTDGKVESLLDNLEKAIKFNVQMEDRNLCPKNSVTRIKCMKKTDDSSVENSSDNSQKVTKRKKKPKNVETVESKPIKTKEYSCKVCSKVFVNLSTYNYHIQQHDGFRFVCEHCGKGFAAKAMMQIHIGYKHKTGRLFSCKFCTFKCPGKFELMLHERTHTGERPFACDKCGMTFHRRSVWKQHAMYHAEKSIQCPKCPRKFFKKGDLMNHYNYVHERYRVFHCTECDSSFSSSGTVRRHLLKVHGIPRDKQGKINRIDIAKVDELVSV